MKAISLAILFMLALVSCQKLENEVEAGSSDLAGTWVSPQYSDTLITYTQADELIENEIGFTFKPNNSLIARQNSGWCGTPPIVTTDYDGTWTRNDSIVNVTTRYWGGAAHFTWRIISLDSQKLVISVVKSEYQQGK